ncbi:4-alpha-glucanotransferase [bacterium]|nr:4-alpha-glucanotransferase [candidate division CSSED10-310 bacterium]
MNMSRSSGVLLHPTSLPGSGTCGSLGKEALHFLNVLHDSGQRLWQILPMNPPGFGFSPYQSISAFAGNPLLIDLPELVLTGLLSDIEDSPPPAESPAQVDYEATSRKNRMACLNAFRSFRHRGGLKSESYRRFIEDHHYWLDDFALFCAIRNELGGIGWQEWPSGLRDRDPDTLGRFAVDHGDSMEFVRFQQYLFFTQWDAVKLAASARGIGIIGDLPIFVSHDSADVWSHREMFRLDPSGKPLAVSGVPPDYFSDDGQKWGNPLYRWDRMADADYSWWVHRFRTLLKLVDVIRLDHFRGFVQFWEIPRESDTARNGEWRDGPGMHFFKSILRQLGELSIIAEDLGVITPDVESLRDALGFPGMKILQFAFGSGPDNPYLPDRYTDRCVVYTGTHDNDTTVGWHRKLSADPQANRETLEHLANVLGHSPQEINWDLIQLAVRSEAVWSIFPVQDLLGMGSSARMNHPGRSTGNWMWRMKSFREFETEIPRLKRLCGETGRL